MALQFLNALLPIFSTPDGSIASVKDSQPENAESPIVVRVDGKLMVVNFLQPENVSDAVSFSLSGRCTSMRFVQPENAELPMESRNICKAICQPLLETDGLTLGGPI